MRQLATVTQASPLKVRIDGSASDGLARVVARGDSWSPALGARVLVDVIGRTVYVDGLA